MGYYTVCLVGDDIPSPERIALETRFAAMLVAPLGEQQATTDLVLSAADNVEWRYALKIACRATESELWPVRRMEDFWSARG